VRVAVQHACASRDLEKIQLGKSRNLKQPPPEAWPGQDFPEVWAKNIYKTPFIFFNLDFQLFFA
jgi:hypothetical protein